MSKQRRKPAELGGFMLLEVLVALLVFSLGVLGLVGLQSAAIKQSGQAKFRADASLLANELIGEMWVSNRGFASLQSNFSSADEGVRYEAWLAKVKTTLPGADSHPPVVTLARIDPLVPLDPAAAAPTPSSRVTVTMKWKAPGEPSSEPPHQLVMVTQIK